MFQQAREGVQTASEHHADGQHSKAEGGHKRNNLKGVCTLPALRELNAYLHVELPDTEAKGLIYLCIWEGSRWDASSYQFQ